MHQPRPYGRFHGEVELTKDDEQAVEALARNLTNFKNVSNLDSLKRTRTLPSGREAVAVDMGGTFRIIILEKHEVDRERFDGIGKTDIPMLFSGVITNAIARGVTDPLGIDDIVGTQGGEPEEKTKENEGVKIKLTEQARRRIAGYESDAKPPKEVELLRFKIKNGLKFSYFEPPITGIFTFTQYHLHRPTWYSGAMKKVMQIVGGYGRQDFAKLPDDAVERAKMDIPDKYMRKIESEMLNVRLPGYAGFPDKKGQFQYDYKFSNCNGVSFDQSGAPWLLQISSKGVYAMPLPIVPATATKAFREYVQDYADDELELVLDTFGGLPSGEDFPIGQDFEAWRRAGVIIKVCDTSDFYDHRAYYMASGWSFNSKGTEAFNTCWNYENTLKHGYAYKMKLQMGAAENRGLVALEWNLDFDSAEDRDIARRVDAYLSSIYSKLTANKARELAIKYKVRRHTVNEILSYANSGFSVDDWDNLEMEPIAQHEGNVNRVARGPIYWGLWMYPQSMGRLKFPALSGEGCESHVMISPDYRGPSVRCDTIVYGGYVDDALQVIKYFIDEREFFREEQSSFEKHMIVGRWDKTVTTGNSGLMGYFYTSDFDDRQEAPPRSTYTDIVGTDLGYSNAAYKTPALLFRVGSVSRSRYYQHIKKTRTTEGFGISVAVCVPNFSRDCILYPYSEGTTGRTETEEAYGGAVADPVSYQMWTNDFIFHYLFATNNGNQGDPYPKEGEFVYVDTMIRTPEADPTGFASSGDWLPLGGGVKDISGIAAKYTSRSAKTHHANGVVIGGEAPTITRYKRTKSFPGESSGRVSISFTQFGSKILHKRKPSQFYYDFSPVDAGGSLLYFYRDVASVEMGRAEYANCSEEDNNGRRITRGNTSLADHKSAHHFIGVINE